MRKSQRKKDILIIRLSPISDVAISLPIAEVIKKHNPNARITWITQLECRNLLQNNPFVDDIIIWPKQDWQALWKQKQLLALLQQIKQFKQNFKGRDFALCIDLQGLLKSGFLGWLSGATRRLAVGSKESSHWFTHTIVSRNTSNPDLPGSEYRYLINQLGYLDESWQIKVYPDEHSPQRCDALLQKHIGDNAYAVILPFGKSAKHQWPMEHWKQLVLRIRGRYQLKTLVIGAREDKDACSALAKQSGAISLANDIDIHQAVTIIEGAAITVGIDNTYTHIAQATDNPSIALFGPNCPYLYTGKEKSKVLYLDRYCSPCKTPICDDAFPCMSDISPDIVLSEVKMLMKLNLYDTIPSGKTEKRTSLSAGPH